MNADILKRLQMVELEILKDLDSFCRSHGIRYSLYAGTLLGAVRHQGFIPWDDDVDVAMSRSEFTKFCTCWKQDPLPGYFFSYYEDDPFSKMNHGKLHKDGTILVSEGEDASVGHHGIWVDIFPLDKLAFHGRQRRRVLAATLRTVLLTRANGTDSTNTPLQKAARAILGLIPYSARRKQLLRDLELFRRNEQDTEEDYSWCELATLSGFRNFSFPINLERFTALPFEGETFPCYVEYETILSVSYGNYMELPPVSEQVCTHNPVILSFYESAGNFIP